MRIYTRSQSAYHDAFAGERMAKPGSSAAIGILVPFTQPDRYLPQELHSEVTSAPVFDQHLHS
jgi:hypothetical protein